MAAARVGTSLRGGSSSAATSHAAAYPQTPTAGSILTLAVSSTRSSSAVLDSIATTGWILAWQVSGSRGTTYNCTSFFVKVAVGGDAVPTISHSASATTTYIAEEWSGLDPALPTSALWPLTGSFTSLSSGGTTAFNTDRTAESANEFELAIFGGRGGGSNTIWSAWDATDLTASSLTTSVNRNAQVFTAYGSIAADDEVKNFTATAAASSDGGAQATLGIVGFALPGGGPPPAELPFAVDTAGTPRPLTVLGVPDAGGTLRPVTTLGVVDAGGVLRPIA